MTSITTDFLSAKAECCNKSLRPFAAGGGYWRQFCEWAFNRYRPELHYMRGPGPAWRAKHMAVSPAVQAMVIEIRTAKAARLAAS